MNNSWRFILKIVGAALAVAGVVCVIVGYWDTICASIGAAREIMAAKRQAKLPDEYDDYADDEL